MDHLSNLYFSTEDETLRNQCISAGQGLITLFDGTAWMASMILVGLSGIIFSILMIRNRFFGKPVGIIGIIVSAVGLAVFVPQIGFIFSLVATIGGVLWYGWIAVIFFRLNRICTK